MNKTFPDPANHPINLEAENKYLKITIAVLREKMEELQRHRYEIIQKTRVSSQDEIIQLQSIVNTLRVIILSSKVLSRSSVRKYRD